MRNATIERNTFETKIKLSIELDGTGVSEISTGVGFFDHMLTLFAKHGCFDLKVDCKGDIEVDAHHTVEDVGLALGSALLEALGNKAGIRRYGHMLLPMDEALIQTALDLSGRPLLVYDAQLPGGAMIGTFDSQLAEEFFRALATTSKMNLHIRQLAGVNLHHIVEGMFKAVARALRMAVESDGRVTGIPSTKGML